ncbi:MAG: glycosyltransferase [Lachnospiraceae bacterium]
MIKILHICAAMNDGGVERMIMNYFSVIDRKQIQFDFVVHSEKTGLLEAKAEALGAKIYHVPAKSRHPFRYFKMMKQILIEGTYDIVHCHQGYKSVYPLTIAKWCRVPARIAHAHIDITNRTLFQRMINSLEAYLTEHCATMLMACSADAGKKMWNKRKFTLISDAIDMDRFRFSQDDRKRIRKELDVDSKFVVECVGRMVEQKNHERLLQIFQKLQKAFPDTALILVGSGPLEEKLKQSAAKKNLSNVFFIGSCEHVEAYLSACDVFVLPTLYEGFGMAVLEAQVNGLETITSDVVPGEVFVSDKIHVLSLTAGDDDWVNAIVSTMGRPREEISFLQTMDWYNIRVQAAVLVSAYQEALAEGSL